MCTCVSDLNERNERGYWSVYPRVSRSWSRRNRLLHKQKHHHRRRRHSTMVLLRSALPCLCLWLLGWLCWRTKTTYFLILRFSRLSAFFTFDIYVNDSLQLCIVFAALLCSTWSDYPSETRKKSERTTMYGRQKERLCQAQQQRKRHMCVCMKTEREKKSAAMVFFEGTIRPVEPILHKVSQICLCSSYSLSLSLVCMQLPDIQ